MALVQPTVIDLLPEDIIALNYPEGSNLGSSAMYHLLVALSIAAPGQFDVNLKLIIRDPHLFTFLDGSTSRTYHYRRKKDTDTVDPEFAIRNLVVLTGMPIRFRIETNDVTTPTVVLPDTSQHPVQ